MSEFRINIVKCNNCGCDYDLAEFDYCPECLMDNEGNDHNGEDNEGRNYDDFLRSDQRHKDLQ
jgi:hypothetical protein